jgi:hypothetical protein
MDKNQNDYLFLFLNQIKLNDNKIHQEILERFNVIYNTY